MALLVVARSAPVLHTAFQRRNDSLLRLPDHPGRRSLNQSSSGTQLPSGVQTPTVGDTGGRYPTRVERAGTHRGEGDATRDGGRL